MNTICQTREELKKEPYKQIAFCACGYEVRNPDRVLIYSGDSAHIARLLFNIKAIA